MRKQFLLMLVPLPYGLADVGGTDRRGHGPQGCGERGAKRGRDQWPALGK